MNDHLYTSGNAVPIEDALVYLVATFAKALDDKGKCGWSGNDCGQIVNSGES